MQLTAEHGSRTPRKLIIQPLSTRAVWGLQIAVRKCSIDQHSYLSTAVSTYTVNGGAAWHRIA